MSAQECADWLGVTSWTVYQLAKKGDLPHLRIGNTLRFLRSQITERCTA